MAVDEERKKCAEIEDEKRQREIDADRVFRAEQAEKDRELKLKLSRLEMEKEKQKMETQARIEMEKQKIETQVRIEMEKQKLETQVRIEMEKQKLEIEKLAFQDKEKDRNFQLNMKKVEMKDVSVNSDDDEGHVHHRGSADYKVLPNQRQNENVLEYFTLFEKTATLHNIKEDRWHLSIGTKFNEATRQVFQRLSIEEMQSYETIKAELLKHFKLSSLTLYTNFRNYEKDPKDTFNQFGNRLTEAFDLYLESKKIKEFDDLHDDVILQQFCENLKGNLRRYVMDKDPKTLAEASGLCDHYVSNISGSPGRTKNQHNSWKEQRSDPVQFNHYGYYDRSPNKFRSSYRRPHYNYRGYDTSYKQFGNQQQGGYSTYNTYNQRHDEDGADFVKLDEAAKKESNSRETFVKTAAPLITENNENVHRAEDTNSSNRFSYRGRGRRNFGRSNYGRRGRNAEITCLIKAEEDINSSFKPYMLNGTINGREVTFLRDSGASRSFIRSDLVQDRDRIPEKQVRISTPQNEPFWADTANVVFTCREVNVQEPTKYEFVLLDYGLPADGIIGNDMSVKIQDFEDLFGSTKLSDRLNEIKSVNNSKKTMVKTAEQTEIKLKSKQKKLTRTRRKRRRKVESSLIGEDEDRYWESINLRKTCETKTRCMKKMMSTLEGSSMRTTARK